MAIVIPVEDGQVVDTSASKNSLSGVNKSSNSSLDKEAFLQLLVAQMKYQDPLEPTSNTEYISQLATFSSLEEMQNLNSSMEAQQGTNLIGKTVIMKTTSNSGETTYVQGKVDYIVRENGNTYVSINEGLYNLDDLDKVIDDDYLDALSIAEDFEEIINALPDVENLTLSDKDKLDTVKKAYNSLTTYQQEFIAKYSTSALKKYQELLNKMEELQKASDSSNDSKDDTDSTDNKDETSAT